MAAEQQVSDNAITVIGFGGLNQRAKFNQTNSTEFDELQGLISETLGTLKRPNGTEFLFQMPEAVRQICQTNGLKGNILVQGENNVYLLTTQEFFNLTTGSNLVPVPTTEEESMSKTIIVHSVAGGTNGGTYTTANTWQQAPLTGILSQLNPDGTAAAFCTFAANQIMLAAGVYRFNGWSIGSDNVSGNKLTAKLFNVTAGANLFLGLTNELGPTRQITPADANIPIPLGGDYQALVPTTIEIQHLMESAQVNTGFGTAKQGGGFTPLAKELYRWLEIIKTA